MASKHTGQNNLVQELGKFAHRVSYRDLPPGVADAARGRLLDTFACCLAGRDLPPARIAAALAGQSKGDCTIFGYRHTSSAYDAAFANSVMAHGTSQDDLMAGVTHPGSAVVPAALAVAEQEGSSGAELLTAITLGYDIVWRVFRATGKLVNPAFRPGTLFTHFGAAAAAAKLMKLDENKLANAIGYAASLTLGAPNEGWWGGTMEPMFELGMTARTGIFCASLARSGATAAPTVLEGKHGFFKCWSGTLDSKDEAARELGKTFYISRTFIKPFATCGANQVPVQVASELAKYRLKPKDIARVIEKVRPGGTDYAGLDFSGPFISHPQALMSMQFCAAAAILGKPLDTPDFITRHFDDLEIAEVAAKVELVSEEGRSAPGFEVHTADGRILTAEGASIERSIHIPTVENMQDKFRIFSQNRLDKVATGQIIEIVMGLDKLKNIGELTARLQG